MRNGLASVLLIAASLVGMLSGLRSAAAEQHLALVVGIDHYANFGENAQLQRAVADAEGIGDRLKTLGFAVTLLARNTSVTQDVFLRKFADFTQSIMPGDTVVFYFAGHGVGLNGINYLVPADIPNLIDADQYMFRAHALAETEIRNRIQDRGAAVTVLMLDACRNNPFRSNDRALGATRGLEPIESTKGVLTIYAAGYGQTALDRLSDVGDPSPNSVFTRVVLSELDKPGINLVDFSEDVRERVAAIARSVGRNQVPAVDNQLLGGRSIYLQGAPVAPASLPVPSPQPAPDEVVWSYVKTSRDSSAFRRFMSDYPASRHKAEAQTQIASLEEPKATVPQTQALPRESPLRSEDDTAWARISSSTYSAEFTAFLERYPRSRFGEQARERLKSLDEALWSQTRTDDVTDLRHYLALFSNGAHQAEARKQITSLEATKPVPPKPPEAPSPPLVVNAPEDATAWARIASSTALSDLTDFIRRFPRSPLRDKAQARLASLAPAKPEVPPQPAEPQVQPALPEAQAPESDKAAWTIIESSIYSSDFRDFMQRFPASPLRRQAEARLRILDDKLWSQTEPKDSTALHHYLATFPEGAHRGDAQRHLRNVYAGSYPQDKGSSKSAFSPAPLASIPPRVAPLVRIYRQEPVIRQQVVAKGSAPRPKSSEGRGCFMSEGERFCP